MKWTRGPDLPFSMAGYIQSVVVRKTLYVGGGYVSRMDKNFIVMASDTDSPRSWRQLPPYRTRDFAMTVLNNQLVLIGGRDRKGVPTNMLGVWEGDSMLWTHPYPPMPTARHWSSAVAYEQWLLVAGGDDESTVEVLNVDSQQWWHAPSTPTPVTVMRSTRVGDMWYLMGGSDGEYRSTNNVYSVSLPALVSHGNSASSSNTPPHIWNIISGLGYHETTPFSIGGSLLSVGGRSVKDRNVVSAIRRYLPETDEWVVVGELPSPLCNCTCSVISAGGLLVAGGCIFKSYGVYVGNLM